MKIIINCIFPIFISLITSCGTAVEQKIDIQQARIDSVIQWAVNDSMFPYRNHYGNIDSLPTIYNGTKVDTLSYQDVLILEKRIYYPQFDITIEFRQSEYCHALVEYIICYDSLNTSIIRLTDNYFFFKSHGDTTKYQDHLCLEKDINTTLQTFHYKTFSPIRDQITEFPDFLINTIFAQSTKFKFVEISSLELPNIRDNIRDMVNRRRSYYEDSCNCNPEKEIKELINRLENRNRARLNFLPFNLLLYEVNVDSKNNCVHLEYINEECYFDIIF